MTRYTVYLPSHTHDPLAIQYSDQVFSMDAGILSPISHHDISQTYDFLR